MTTFCIPPRGARLAFLAMEGEPGPGRHRRGGHRGRPGPFGPGGPGGRFVGGGRKAGRGDIRAAIVALLAEEPMHGYQIIREIAERSEGVWRPSPGSVYPTLQQLEDEDLIRAAASPTGKRVFELTDEGRTLAGNQTSKPWEAAADEAGDTVHGLQEVAWSVMGALRQIGSHGTPSQLEAAKEILADTRRRLYGVLAEDGQPPQA
jgi:DNA-binding PadR family transcriptional regulator